MEQQKIGRFITERRKVKGLTQGQLAENLQVTVQAVSKWECGKGMPDSGLMLALAEQLGVTVTEILNGESVPKEKEIAVAENNAIILLQKIEGTRLFRDLSEQEKKELSAEYKQSTSAKMWAKLNVISIFQSAFWVIMFCLSTFLNWGQIATTVILVSLVMNATLPLIILLIRTMLFSFWLNIAKNIKDDKVTDSSFA